MFHEQLFPDQIGLGGFGQLPEPVAGCCRVTETFGDQVMVNQQIVDAPEQQLLEGRVIEVRVDVTHRRGGYDPLHPPLQMVQLRLGWVW
jgi:hypothetical protein